MITGALTDWLAVTGIINLTGALRAARLFRFELFFFAATSNCSVNNTITTDRAMNKVRNGLTTFDSPFGPPDCSLYDPSSKHDIRRRGKSRDWAFPIIEIE